MPIDFQKTQVPGASVRLVSRKALASALIDDVVIVPTDARWDDFGTSVHASFGFRTDRSKQLTYDGEAAYDGTFTHDGRVWVSGYFAIKGESNLAKFVSVRISAQSEESILLSELDVAFAALLGEAKHYGLLRRGMEVGEAQRMLRAIHDVSLLAAEGKSVPGWPEFFNSTAFTHAMSRNSEGYFAFRHGARSLQNSQDADVDARAPLRAVLTGFGPRLSFNFRFDAENALRGRIAVVIGRNGTGKTSALSRIARALATKGKVGARLTPTPEVNQVLVFANSAALKLFRPRGSGARAVRTFPLDPYASARAHSRENWTRLLVDIARAHDENGPLLSYLQHILNEEFPHIVMFVPVVSDSVPDVQVDHIDSKGRHFASLTKWMRGGEGAALTAAAAVDHKRELLFLDARGGPRSLSLGQSAFLNFALTALANTGSSSYILIDEPENFLHPNLLSKFIKILHRILEGTKSVAIVATHSPFVVREVQNAQVHIIRPDNAKPGSEGDEIRTEIAAFVVQPRLQTLGANVAAISNEVFDDDLPQHLYSLLMEKADVASIPFSQVLSQYAGELSIEALMQLRRLIERRDEGSSS